jgi:hypothetical protein
MKGLLLTMSNKTTLPNDIPDLIKRLETASLEVSERDTLQVLCRAVVLQLDSNSISKCAWEAARLSRFLSDDTYIQLLRIFTNSIASGTQDRTSPDPELLQCLIFVIRVGQVRNISIHNNPLGSLLDTLKSRLETAQKYSDKQQQYDLICTISATLDAMVDVGISGLNREAIHKPFLNTLDSLSDEPELHLAQAASYAAQALQSVPDDDDPGDAIIRRFLRTVNIAMMITGGVLSKDPQKLYEAAREVYKAGSDLKKYVWNRVKADTKRSWYMTLRVTEVLIRVQAFDELQGYVSRVACRTEKFFLCGLCAQLERYQKTFPGQQCQDVYKSLQTDIPRVQAWIHFSTSKLTQKQQASTDNCRPHIWKSRNGRQYEWSLAASPIIYQAKHQFNIITSQDLLNKAYKSCPEVLRYYAKESLKHHYSNDDRLHINRLSGETLPMDQCYINLAVVSASDSQEITLRELFNHRHQQSGKIAQPRQVFIEGQAGVGKTTLCKRMTYDFLYNGLWNDRFDWLIWLPLRKLKEQPSTASSLRGLFAYQFFTDQFDEHRDLLAEFMWKEADNTGESNRVLFLLDGLDEITHFWDDDTAMKQLLRRLMQGPQTVILTTRPYGTNIAETSTFDFKLRTVGFNPNQIESYINAPEINPERKKAEQIVSFVKSHPQIENVMRIPIQLDALCYTWDDSSQDGDTFQTMTAIYEAIQVSLLRKDAVKLGKVCNGRVLNHSSASELSARELCDLMSKEINLLEGIAFQGFYNGCIEFDRTTRDHIHKYLNDQGEPLPQSHNSTLRKLSFIRSSDEGAGNEEKNSFHFIHLTFQEYFAACYFIKYWLKGDKIPCIELRNNRYIASTSVLPRIFLGRQKYNTRYNMIWRFAIGLVHARSDQYGQQLTKFFGQLEAEPRDLLGPAHHRLLAQCLGELPTTTVSNSEFGPYRERIEKKLCWWLLFECNAHRGNSILADVREYPEHLMYAVFQQTRLDVKMRILSSMDRSTNFFKTGDILDLAQLWVTKRQVNGKDLEYLAFKLIARHDQESRRKSFDLVRQHILSLITYTEMKTYIDAAVILSSGMGSSAEAWLKMALQWLQHKDAEWRIAASRAFKRFRPPSPSLPPATAHSLILWLLYEDPVVKAYRTVSLRPQPLVVSQYFDALDMSKEIKIRSRFTAAARASVIQRTPHILPMILKETKEVFKYSDDYTVHESLHFSEARVNIHVRENLLIALKFQPDLPSETQEFLVRQLDSEDIVVIQSAADVLEALSNLSHTSLRNLGDRLKVVDSTVRRSLIRCFENHRALPQNVTQVLLEELKNQPHECAEEAANVLGGTKLSRETLVGVVKMLSYEASRPYATEIIRQQWKQSPISSDILHEGWEYSDSDPFTWPMSPWQPDMSLGDLDALASIVEDGDAELYLRHRVIYAIEGQSRSQPRVLDAMVRCIKDKDSIISQVAANALCNHSDLPPGALEALVSCLRECLHSPTKKLAADALNNQPYLLQGTLDALVSCLHESHNHVAMYFAGKVLSRYSALPSKTLDALVDCLHESRNLATKKSAIEVLGKQQSVLPSTAVERLRRCLDDKHLRRIAAAALWEQSNAFPGALEVLLEYLDSKAGLESSYTVYTLGQSSSLPPKALDALLGRLNRSNWESEINVREILKNQSTLSPDILYKISLQFSTHNMVKSGEVLAQLRNRDEFYRWLPNMDWEHFRCFYQACIFSSFYETFIIILKDKSLIVQLPDTQKVIHISSLRDRLKLRAYFAVAQFLVSHGERREVRWDMERVPGQGKLALFWVLPIIFAMVLAYLWF